MSENVSVLMLGMAHLMLGMAHFTPGRARAPFAGGPRSPAPGRAGGAFFALSRPGSAGAATTK
jgi:hypothetical protein